MLKDQIERLCVCGLSSCRIHSTVRKRGSEQRRFFSGGCLIYRICALFASSRVLIASTFFSVSAAPNPAQRAKLLRPIGRFAAAPCYLIAPSRPLSVRLRNATARRSSRNRGNRIFRDSMTTFLLTALRSCYIATHILGVVQSFGQSSVERATPFWCRMRDGSSKGPFALARMGCSNLKRES